MGGANRVKKSAFGTVERGHGRGVLVAGCQTRGIDRVWQCRGGRSGSGGCGWCQPREEIRVRHHRARPHAGRPASGVPDASNTPPLAVSRGPVRPVAGCGWCQPREESPRPAPSSTTTARDGLVAGCQTRGIRRVRHEGRGPTRQRRTPLVPTALRCTAVGTTQRPCTPRGSLGIDHLVTTQREPCAEAAESEKMSPLPSPRRKAVR